MRYLLGLMLFLGIFGLGVQAHAGTMICDGKFHWVDVPNTKCGDGSQTGFQYYCPVGGSGANLVLWFDSGGLCIDSTTCDCQPDQFGACTNPNALISINSFNKSVSDDGLAPTDDGFGAHSGFNGSGFEPLLKLSTRIVDDSYTIVWQPYCTGDLYMGNKVRPYIQTVNSHKRAVPFYHYGYKNVVANLKVIKQMAVPPKKVILWGESAGGLGTDCNFQNVIQAFPGLQFSVLNFSGNLADPQFAPYVSAMTQNWGAWHPEDDGRPSADTCPILVNANTFDWSPNYIARFNKVTYPNFKKAYVEDYADATIGQFFCALGANIDPPGTPNDSDGTNCVLAVAAAMNYTFDNFILANDPNYKVFFHDDVCHGYTDPGAPDDTFSCDWANYSQNGISLQSWLKGFLGINGFSWDNVKLE